MIGSEKDEFSENTTALPWVFDKFLIYIIVLDRV